MTDQGCALLTVIAMVFVLMGALVLISALGGCAPMSDRLTVPQDTPPKCQQGCRQ